MNIGLFILTHLLAAMVGWLLSEYRYAKRQHAEVRANFEADKRRYNVI